MPLRQTEGFMNSLARLMGAAVCIPDFSCISERAIELPPHILSKAQQPGSPVIVDSTGLKVLGKDVWHQVARCSPGQAFNIKQLAPQRDVAYYV